MCGIAGALGPHPFGSHEIARGMLDTLAHRGPDGRGFVRSGECWLGQQRLAIIDLAAPPGPCSNETGTVLSVCNGQIYNSLELREELERKGHRFTTGVDTEVIPHLWEELGTELVSRLDGMFAFALWDSRRRVLVLARDRAGEKPLYYWTDGSRVLFASEIRALVAHPAVSPRLDPDALLRYLAHGFFPAPLSPLRGVRKLPPAHLLVASDGGLSVSRYWNLDRYFGAPGTADARSPRQLSAELDDHLRRAVHRRSRSDVAIGVLLSGGIDSATVLSYVAEAQGSGVPAFTIGHADPSFDESAFAHETARFFGADLRRLVLDRADLEEGLERIGTGMDEPLGDASTIPTHLIARLARRHVKVVLSGEGADELFAGYPTYLGHRLADALANLPPSLRGAMVGAARRCLPVTMGNVGLDYLLQRFASALDRNRLERHQVWFGAIHPERLGGLLAPRLLAGLDQHPATPYAPIQPSTPLPDPLAELLYTDFCSYLPDDLLTKIDRAAMLASLEVRAPFLDHTLVEFVAGIPSRLKLRGLTTKVILRRTVRDRLPHAVLARRKRGFNIPFSRWVLDGLGDSLRRRFDRERVRSRGLFAFEGIERLIEEHMSRQADHHKPLYTLLALDLWCDRTFGDGAEVPIDHLDRRCLVHAR